MKVIAFTDLHENLILLERIKKIQEQEQAQLIICTGDFTIFGRQTRTMLQHLDRLGVPVILIHGNHEDEDEVAQLVVQCKNIHFVHNRMIDFMGYRFIGFGGGGFNQEEPALLALERKFASKFNDKTIFLSHAPPHNTLLDQRDEDWHVGNQTLRALIRRRQPLLVLCGHIHECFHRHDELAGTMLINPGPDGEIIELE